jgi:hypothetical protein
MNYRGYKIILRVEHFYTNRERLEVYIYRWGAGVAVTGRIRDIGQNVLRSASQTGRSSSPSYFHIFFRFAFID